MSCLLRAGIGSEQEMEQDSTPEAFEDGVRFGVYEIDCHADGNLYELGRGAMGVTYRATDTYLQRKVALRSLRSTSLSEALTRAKALCAKPVQPQHCDTNTSPPSSNSECALRQDNIFTRWNSSTARPWKHAFTARDCSISALLSTSPQTSEVGKYLA
jgi:hypothetical protein